MVAAAFLLPVLALATPEKAPEGFVEMVVVNVLATEDSAVVILRDRAKTVVVPIFIGTTEAAAIHARLHNQPRPRPMTHDLLETVVHDLGAEIARVHIDQMRGSTFLATLYLRQGGKESAIDARPSDSIALALGSGAPIFVAKPVVASAGKDLLVAPPSSPATESLRPTKKTPTPPGVDTL